MTRRAFVAVAITTGVIYSGTNMVAPLFPIYIAQLHLSGFGVTAVFAIFAIGVLAALFILRARSQTTSRTVLVTSIILTVAASLCFFFARTTFALLCARFCEGLAIGSVSATANGALRDLSPRRDAAYPAAVGSIATTIGFATGPLLAGFLADWFPASPRSAFVVLTSCCVATLLLLVTNMPARSSQRLRQPNVALSRSGRAPLARSSITFAVSWLAGPLFLALGPSVIIGMLHVTAHALAGLTIFVIYLSASLGQLLTRRLQSRVMLRYSNIQLIAGVSAAAVAVHVQSLALFIVAICLSGMAQGNALRGSLTMINETVPPESSESALNAVFLCVYIPMAVLTPAVGLLEDRAGLAPAFLAFALVLALAASIALTDLCFWRPQAPT